MAGLKFKTQSLILTLPLGGICGMSSRSLAASERQFPQQYHRWGFPSILTAGTCRIGADIRVVGLLRSSLLACYSRFSILRSFLLLYIWEKDNPWKITTSPLFLSEEQTPRPR